MYSKLNSPAPPMNLFCVTVFVLTVHKKSFKQCKWWPPSDTQIEINWVHCRNVNVTKILSGFKILLWKFTNLLSLAQGLCLGGYVKGREFHFKKKVSISLQENRIKHKSVSSLPSPDASLFNYAGQWPCAFTFLIQSCCPLRGIADASLCGDLKIVTRGRKEGNILKVAVRVSSCLTSVFPVFPSLPPHIIPRPLVLTESLLILQPLDYSNNSSGMVHRREVWLQSLMSFLIFPKREPFTGCYYIRLRFLQDSTNVQFSLFLSEDRKMLTCKINCPGIQRIWQSCDLKSCPSWHFWTSCLSIVHELT